MTQVLFLLVAQALCGADGPAADPRVTFRCGFEKEHCDAEVSAGRPEQNGVGWELTEGRSGRGMLLDKPNAYARYVALRNVPAEDGTVSLWIRSKPGANLWNDGRDHFVLVLRTRQFLSSETDPRCIATNHQLWIVKRGQGNTLELSVQRGMHDSRKPLGEVETPVGHLAPHAWHRVRAGWSNAKKRIVLRVNDEEPREAAVSGLVAPREWVLFYVGNSHIYRRPLPLDGVVDDLEFVTTPPF